jgi:hypothetical protein
MPQWLACARKYFDRVAAEDVKPGFYSRYDRRCAATWFFHSDGTIITPICEGKMRRARADGGGAALFLSYHRFRGRGLMARLDTVAPRSAGLGPGFGASIGTIGRSSAGCCFRLLTRIEARG